MFDPAAWGTFLAVPGFPELEDEQGTDVPVAPVTTTRIDRRPRWLM